MNIRKTRLAALGLALAVLVSIGTGGLASSAGEATPAEAPDNASVNLTAIHDPHSRQYDGNCLGCHSGILTQSSRDPRVLAFHQAMIPYTPGYSARKGVQNVNCITCHRDAIDFQQESGTSLRRTVSVESCVYCHGRSGPGPVYFE